MDPTQSKLDGLAKLAAELILSNEHMGHEEIESLSQVYFMKESDVGPMHLHTRFFSTPSCSMYSLTPEQKVKIHLLWVQDHRFGVVSGADLDVDKIKRLVTMKEKSRDLTDTN